MMPLQICNILFPHTPLLQCTVVPMRTGICSHPLGDPAHKGRGVGMLNVGTLRGALAQLFSLAISKLLLV